MHPGILLHAIWGGAGAPWKLSAGAWALAVVLLMMGGGEALAQQRRPTRRPPDPQKRLELEKRDASRQGTRRGGSRPASETTPAQVLVTRLVQGACRGRCPAYEARLFADGRLEFDGQAHVARLGPHVYLVPRAFIKNLAAATRQARVGTLKDAYPTPEEAPVYTLFTTLGGGGRGKTITFSQSEAPAELTRLREQLHLDLMAILDEQEPFMTPQSAAPGDTSNVPMKELGK